MVSNILMILYVFMFSSMTTNILNSIHLLKDLKLIVYSLCVNVNSLQDITEEIRFLSESFTTDATLLSELNLARQEVSIHAYIYIVSVCMYSSCS